jgi:Zn-finger nucleic acid-binding protein
MNCPSCSAEMTEESFAGVRLDVCHVCHGAWFDGGELEDYHRNGGSARLAGVPGPKAHYEPTGESAHRKCPRCESDILRTGRISRYRVLRCTTCKGLFLPLPDPRSDSRQEMGILSAAVGALETIVRALF